MTRPFEPERTAAIAAVLRAVRLTEQVRAEGLATQRDKADASPVTVADFAAQALIVDGLAGRFPDDPIVGEESADALRAEPALLAAVHRLVAGVIPDATPEQVCAWIDRGASRAEADRFWTVDPIDGTKGYLRGMAYSVGVALVIEGRPVVSAIACPWLPEQEGGALFWAVRGGGAWERPLAGGAAERCSVSTRAPADARRVESYEAAHADRDRSAASVAALGVTQPPLRIDSMVKYAMVARGSADLYLRVPRGGYDEKVWDHAAGGLLVEEAGGQVTTLAGERPHFRGARFSTGGALVASSGQFHQAVLDALRA